MITNPIYKKESLVTWKNIGLVMLIFTFNTVLLSYYIFQLNTSMNSVILNFEVNYQVFLNIFKNALLVIYTIILIIVPIMSGSSISREIERKSFDIILSTMLKSKDIIFGKLSYCVINMCILLIGIMPILALVLIYGGLSTLDFFRIILSLVILIFFLSSMGIYISAVFKKTELAIAVSYTTSLVFVISSFICTPLNSFYIALNYVNIYTDFFNNIYLSFDNKFAFISMEYKFISGIIVQFILGIIFIVLSIKCIRTRK